MTYGDCEKKMNAIRYFAFLVILSGLAAFVSPHENAAAQTRQNVLQLQLRSRAEIPKESQLVPYIRDRAIQYRTVTWNASETALVCEFSDTIAAKPAVESPGSARDLKRFERAREIIDHAETLGLRLGNTGSAKNVLFLVRRLTPEAREAIDKAVQEGKNVAVFRDMIYYDAATDDAAADDAASVKALQNRDEAIRQLEREVCPTIDSCDWLGKPAFRFPEDQRPHVAFLVSDDHYHADKTLPVFAEEFAAEQGFYATIMHGEGTHRFAHTAELSTVDVLVVLVRRLAPPKEQLDAIRDYVASERGGVIGMRTASHAFDTKGNIPDGQANWLEFDREILGGNYHNHGRNDLGTDVAPARNATGKVVEHPVLDGIEAQQWHSLGSLYWTAPIKDDALLLQTGSSEEGQNEPLTWLRQHGQTRVAYTGLGYHRDFEVEAFRQLLSNLICWASQKSP